MGTPDPRVKWFVCLTLLVVGLMALGVGVLIGRENAALAENLVVAEGVVVRRYAVSGAGSNGSNARDYSADVAVASPAIQFRVPMLRAQFDAHPEQSTIAVAYQASNPSNNRIGPDVDALLRGELDAEAFMAARNRVIEFAMSAGAVSAVLGLLLALFWGRAGRSAGVR